MEAEVKPLSEVIEKSKSLELSIKQLVLDFEKEHGVSVSFIPKNGEMALAIGRGPWTK